MTPMKLKVTQTVIDALFTPMDVALGEAKIGVELAVVGLDVYGATGEWYLSLPDFAAASVLMRELSKRSDKWSARDAGLNLTNAQMAVFARHRNALVVLVLAETEKLIQKEEIR